MSGNLPRGIHTPWGFLEPEQFPEGSRIVPQEWVERDDGVLVTKYPQIWGQAFTFAAED